DEPQHADRERLPPVEAIEEERSDHTSEPRGERVGRDCIGELRLGHPDRWRERWPERRDQNEVDDVDELNRADEENDRALGDDATARCGDARQGSIFGASRALVNVANETSAEAAVAIARRSPLPRASARRRTSLRRRTNGTRRLPGCAATSARPDGRPSNRK